MKKKLIVAFVLFTGIGVAIFYLLTTGTIGAKYNTAEARMGDVEQFVEEAGRISSGNIRRYFSTGAGRIDEMPLELGDHVNKGQLLIQYDDSLDLEIQQIEKQIEALEASYRETLAGTDVERLNSARIEISRIRTDLELAEKNEERSEELYRHGAISLFELEQAANQADQLRSSLAIARNTYNELAKGVSANTRARYEAEIDGLRITLDIYRKNREENLIYSDTDGVVTEINAEAGDVPSPGSMILEIQDSSRKVILADFMVEDALRIRPGMQVEIADRNLGIQIDNLKVERIHPKAFITLSELGVRENRQTVEIRLPASGEDLLPYGLEVRTRVMLEEPRQALLVPRGALYQKDGKMYLEVLDGRKPVEREIITGVEVQDKVEVTEGVREGELVIVKYQVD